MTVGLLERNLNAYESMLATSTCNVAVACWVPSSTSLNENIQQAWKQTIAQRGLLQVTLEASQGGRYKTLLVVDHSNLPAVTIHHREDKDPTPPELLKMLQRQGTVDMDITKATYVMTAITSKHHYRRRDELDGPDSSSTIVDASLITEPNLMTAVSFFLTLCHAVSDGPGTLHVLNDFLQNLQDVVQGKQVTTISTPTKLVDIQALLLGSTYGADLEPMKDELVYPGLEDFKAALTSEGNTDRRRVLPPEALQQLPSDQKLPAAPSEIDALSFTLTKDQTTGLRTMCRSWGGTVQGAISVACLVARLVVLYNTPSLPITCALQIPVNTRGTVPGVDETECLCGSAGVWHTLHLESTSSVGSLIQLASTSVKDAVAKKQHIEWLRRLMNDPASLPAYSLMVSSIGVAPIQKFYADDDENRRISVVDGVFFGGALANKEQPSSAQATMVHVTTFCEELEFTLSFTAPGVAKQTIGHGIINLVQRLLVAIATEKLGADDTVSTAFHLLREPE